MIKKLTVLITVLAGAFLFNSALMAKEAPKAPETRKPIVMKWTTMEGMRYYFTDQKIKNLEGLKEIISPLNDPEANRLLTVSKNSHDSGVAFLIGGGVLFVGGLVIFGVDPNSGTNNFNLDSQQVAGVVTTLVGLFVGGYVGAFKLVESRTSEFAAVQRYNAIVHGDDLTAMVPREHTINADLLALKY